jgi:prepilin signal peptidase PulO-like enzyme (type II secretory pathway)
MHSFREGLFQIPAFFIVAIFFIFIFILNWIGYSFRKRFARLQPDKELELGTVEGSLLGLMALLLAFSFSMAATKFESRRQTIIDEANLLNTAILRCDLYPDSIKRSLLPGYKNYLEARIGYYEAGDDPVKIKAALYDADKQFKSMWNNVLLLSKAHENNLKTEQMIQIIMGLKNIKTTREAGRMAAVPALIIVVLLIIVFGASFLTGFGIKPGKRSTLPSIAFALMTSIVLYLVMELSRPRQGFVNLSSAEEKLVELRKMFP